MRRSSPASRWRLSYMLHWYGDDPSRPPGGRAVATRRDHGTVPGGYRFVIDFDGDRLRGIPADRPPNGVVTAGPGADAAELIDQHVVKNPATGGWRLSFQLKPKSSGADRAARLPDREQRRPDRDLVERAAPVASVPRGAAIRRPPERYSVWSPLMPQKEPEKIRQAIVIMAVYVSLMVFGLIVALLIPYLMRYDGPTNGSIT